MGEPESTGAPSLAGLPLGRFLDLVAARSAAPAGGAVAAVTVAGAAALVTMTARFSGPLPAGGADLAARADLLRERALTLAREDGDAYAAVLAAAAAAREGGPGTGGVRAAGQTAAAGGGEARLRQALRVAAEVPLRIADLAAQVAGLGLRLVEDGNPSLRPDAVSAILLAEAAARSAAGMVRANAAWGKLGPGLPDQAEAFVRAATLARERSAAPGTS